MSTLDDRLLEAEWLEPDGLGGFASGTVKQVRTRRYHALLLAATNPPTGRMVLVNGFDVGLRVGGRRYPLTAQMYLPRTVQPPEAIDRLVAFTDSPWPTWTFRTEDGTELQQELVMRADHPLTVLRWRLLTPAEDAVLDVRPFLSGRDYHGNHGVNVAFRFEPRVDGERRIWHPYDGVPEVHVLSNGIYTHDAHWYRNFLYEQERIRGLLCNEDLATPGYYTWELAGGKAALVLAAGTAEADPIPANDGAVSLANACFEAEQERRDAFPDAVQRAADAYIVKRGQGKTILAGYPWFSDWGRDTFIAIRGLCLATGRLDEAEQILTEWAGTVSMGMLPNRFPDYGETPEFNSVDASLWYITAVRDFFSACEAAGRTVSTQVRGQLRDAVLAILGGYYEGTRFRIHCDDDGLIAAGETGTQLTWMDAKVGEWVVTPRCGKPVEIQALWLNALAFGAAYDDRWAKVHERGRKSFQEKFWFDDGGYLVDVLDWEHQPGRVDSSFRPNQILAVGGLPDALLAGERARRVVDEVESRLYTPVGLRSLDPHDPDYHGRYEGTGRERDGAYHRGTAWAWQLGPFVEAWVRVRGDTAEARAAARQRFLEPLQEHLAVAGLNHVSEIADGDHPHTPRGCPFQAWSTGELLRLQLQVLAD